MNEGVATTHEPELTGAVDLCTPDGRHLNPAARGWSRRPLHRANLRGVWGRTKRWDYWAVLTDRLVVSLTVADIDYLGLVAAGWIDLTTGRSGGRTAITPFGLGVHVPERAHDGLLRHRSRKLEVTISYPPGAAHLRASWVDEHGTPCSLAVEVADPPGHESLNVVIPWSDTRFQFTSKHQARPATGTITIGDRTVAIGRTAGGGAGEGGEAWGVYDAGRGWWPYRTRWNWGGGAGRSTDDRVVGIQIGGKWTDGTGFTENGILVDGRLVKLGADLAWRYRWDAPLEPWTVRSPDGALDLTLHPTYDRHERTDALVLSTEVHQVFGRWTGTVPDGAGGTLAVDGVLGFAEESRSRW